MLKILLIEDSTADQVAFVDKVQNESGLDVAVDCASAISEAFSYLETARDQPYDQIYLDPTLPDLKPNTIGQVLATLKRHVEPGELRVLTGTASPELIRQAKQQDVSLLHKDALNADRGSSEILALLQALQVRRSDGATQRVELGKHEIRLLNIESSLDEVKHFLKDSADRMRLYEETAMQVRMMTELLKQLPDLKTSIAKLEKMVDKETITATNRTETRKSFLQYALPALLTATTAIATILLTQYFSGNKPNPAPAVSPSSSPAAK